MIVLWGSNAREAHPIFFHHLMKGLDNGARMFCVDPRRTSSAKFADVWLGLSVGTDIALANAIGRHIIANGWHDQAFIDHATTGFEAYRAAVEPYTLEHASAITGVPAAAIAELAEAYATAGKAQILWTLGITEHHNAVDNVLSLCNLALLTGHVGRWGSGLVPLRGQNNVQGGGDMGALPDKLPGFQDITDPDARAKFERTWGASIPAEPGIHLTLMFEAMETKALRAVYCLGENPADSEADVAHARSLALRARSARGAGHLPDPNRRVGRRGLPRLGRLGRVRGHRHLERTSGPAGTGRGASAGRRPPRHRHHRRPRRPHGRRLGPPHRRRNCGTSCARCRRCIAGCRGPGSRPRAACSGPAPTRTIPAAPSSTVGCGRTISAADPARRSTWSTTRGRGRS